MVFSSSIKEDHGQSIFGVQFNYHLRKDQPLMFASCGTNRISVYECPKEGGLKMLQAYADPDVSIVIRYTHVSSLVQLGVRFYVSLVPGCQFDVVVFMKICYFHSTFQELVEVIWFFYDLS